MASTPRATSDALVLLHRADQRVGEPGSVADDRSASRGETLRAKPHPSRVGRLNRPGFDRGIEPLQKRLAGGCHLTRRISDSIEQLDSYYFKGEPKPFWLHVRRPRAKDVNPAARPEPSVPSRLFRRSHAQAVGRFIPSLKRAPRWPIVGPSALVRR
jgi:hypothetical protein